MKKKIFSTLALVVASVLLWGITANAATLNLAMDADPVSLDPHVQLSGGMLQYSHMVFDPLVRWAPDGSFEPRLAEKWEVVNLYFAKQYFKKHSILYRSAYLIFRSTSPLFMRNILKQKLSKFI